jgi:hypothetical protein
MIRAAHFSAEEVACGCSTSTGSWPARGLFIARRLVRAGRLGTVVLREVHRARGVLRGSCGPVSGIRALPGIRPTAGAGRGLRVRKGPPGRVRGRLPRRPRPHRRAAARRAARTRRRVVPTPRPSRPRPWYARPPSRDDRRRCDSRLDAPALVGVAVTCVEFRGDSSGVRGHLLVRLDDRRLPPPGPAWVCRRRVSPPIPESPSRHSTSADADANCIAVKGECGHSSQPMCRSTISRPCSSLPVTPQKNTCAEMLSRWWRSLRIRRYASRWACVACSSRPVYR